MKHLIDSCATLAVSGVLLFLLTAGPALAQGCGPLTASPGNLIGS